MKHLLLLFIFCLMCFSQAYSRDGRGFYIDGSAGFSNEYTDHHGQWTVGMGYQFNNKLAGGFRAMFQSGDGIPKSRLYSPYVRYSFLKAGKFDIYTDGALTWGSIDQGDTDNDVYNKSYSDFEGGLNLGAAYNISQHWGIFVNAFFLGYSDTSVTHKGAVLGDGRFILDANWRRTALGVRFFF